jgi:hypothetical protein
LEAIKIAREDGALLLPIFKHFQMFYDAAVNWWLRCNPVENVTQFVVTALLAEAYSKAVALNDAENEFNSTGIWPVDRAVFSDHDFMASKNLNSEQTPQERIEDLQQKMNRRGGKEADLESEVTHKGWQTVQELT